MPASVLHPNAVPADVVLEEKKEKKEDASTVAWAVGEQVHDLQATLDALSQRMGKLHGAIRNLDNENHILRNENTELKTQLARGLNLSGNPAFAGTGEMPPTPRETDLPSKMQAGSHHRGGRSPGGRQSPEELLLAGDHSCDFYDLGLPKPQPGNAGSPTPPAGSPTHPASRSPPPQAGSPTSLTKKPQLMRGSTKNELRKRRSTLTGMRTRGVFADTNAIKEEVRKAIARPQFDVTDLYKETGIAQCLARHPAFEYVTLAIISLNAIWIAVDTELNTGGGVNDSDPVFTVADNFFCTYFVWELTTRFLAFESKRNVFKDAWFGFDLGLVVVMIIETWILPTAFKLWGQNNGGVNLSESTLLKTVRLVRVTRMARMVKLLRCVPELIIVIKGIGVALRSVMYTWILMVAVIYVFAIAFRQITFNTKLGNKYFNGVFEAMYTLLLRGTLPDLAEFMLEVGQESVGLAIILMLFILLVSLTVMNMLIGVLVDVVGVVSKVENYELQVAFVKQKLLSMLETSGIDEDGNHHISRQEFGLILVKPEAAKILYDLGVDPVGLVDFTEFIFKDEEELDFPRFMEVILQLRGSNTATVRDVVDMRKWVAEEFRHLERSLGCESRTGSVAPRMIGNGPTPPPHAPSPTSRPAWGPQVAKKPISNSPTPGQFAEIEEENVKTVAPDRRSPGTPPHIAALRKRQGASSPWKADLEDDMWDEEV